LECELWSKTAWGFQVCIYQKVTSCVAMTLESPFIFLRQGLGI
jgi:hypothetical protein